MPFDIGPNLREIALAIAENANDEGVGLKFIHRAAEVEIEVVLKIAGKGNYEDK